MKTSDDQPPLIGDDFRRTIAQKIRSYNPDTGLIDLSECDIDERTIGWVVSRLRLLDGLTSLNIASNAIGEVGAIAIAKDLTTLTTLNIASNEIGEVGAAAIAKHLIRLTTLNIAYNSIDKAGAIAIAKYLTALSTLYVQANSLCRAGAIAVAEHLTSLTTLNITRNQICDEGAVTIAKHLKALRALSISSNEIGTEGATAIAEHLSELTTLDISINSIGDVGVHAIAGSLTALTTLDIGFNSIGEGAVAIAEHLSALTALTNLDIGYNMIDEAGGLAIAEHLTALTRLSIEHNKIGTVGAVAIAKHLTALTTLNIEFNNIGKEGAVAIAKHLTALTTLAVGGNSIGDAGVLAIGERLTALTMLHVASNEIRDAGVIVALLERVVGPTASRGLNFIDLKSNPLCWPEMDAPISDAVLLETNPGKLLQLLVSLRDSSTDLAAAGVAFIGKTTFGKTHAARWTTASEAEYAKLRRTLDHCDGTWGYDRYTVTLTQGKHRQSELRDIYVTVIDVGGHPEQLMAASNLVYMNSRRSVFVLVVKATETFVEGNWGRYYLGLIQSLHLRRRSHDERRRVELYDASEGSTRSRIPVLILVTHTDEDHKVQLPNVESLERDFPLIDVESVNEWEAPRGDEYLPVLLRKLGEQLGKVQHLRGITLGFIKPLIERISDAFDLAQHNEADYWKGCESIGMDKFRTICVELGGKTEAEQDTATRELESFGYIARTSDELRSDTRLLNPRFINYFLFQRILKDVETRASDGFMSASRLDELTRSITSDQDRNTMLRLMQECLVTFEWHDAPGPRGIFVPDLLPMRASVVRPELAGVLYSTAYKPDGFLSEEHYFLLIAAHKERLRVAGVERRSDGSRREIRVFRDECVLGDARYHGDDKYHARLTVDVIEERVIVEVIGVGEGANTVGAEKFTEHVLGWLEEQAQCGFRVVSRRLPVGTPKWELEELQSKAEAFAEKYGFIVPQKFFAMILSCSQSSLSTVINGKPNGSLKPSEKLLAWRTTKKKDLGRVDLRKHGAIFGAILDSTEAVSNEEESPEWKDEVAAVAKLRIDAVLAELTCAESGQVRRELEESLRNISEDVLRHFLVKRRMYAKK